MSSNPPAPAPTITFLQVLAALLGDAPDIVTLITDVEAALAAEKVATTYVARVAAAIPALQQAAIVADKLKGQL